MQRRQRVSAVTLWPQELANQDIIRQLKLEHAKEITKLRQEFELQVSLLSFHHDGLVAAAEAAAISLGHGAHACCRPSPSHNPATLRPSCVQARELQQKYEKKMKMLRDDLELR